MAAGGALRQQGPGCSSEPIGRCQWRCGVVDARPCFSGLANSRPGVKRRAWRSGGDAGAVPFNGSGGGWFWENEKYKIDETGELCAA